MKLNKSISFLIGLVALLVVPVHSFAQNVPDYGQPVPAQVAPFTPPEIAPNPRAQASPAAFDGQALYSEAFALIMEYHVRLADKAERDRWAAEWQNKFANTDKLNTEAGTDAAIEEMLASLGQRFDGYVNESETAANRDRIDPTLTGVGISVKLNGMRAIIKSLPQNATQEQFENAQRVGPGHEFLIEEVNRRGPSHGSLQAGDIIRKVDGQPIEGMLMSEVIAKIRGKEDTTVSLTVERVENGQKVEHTFTITRKRVVREVVHTRDLGNGMTYIKLDDFMSQYSVQEMREALTNAANGKGIVLDLRNNPGGNLQYVLEMAANMLSEGTILVTHVRNGDALDEHEIIAGKYFIIKIDPDPSEPGAFRTTLSRRPKLLVPEHMPIVVLVNQYSASASELLSGTLQHHRRAEIVGQPTAGKGVGQTMIPLSYRRSISITSFEFRPGGDAIDWKGIIPNRIVEAVDDDAEVDEQLEAARARLAELIAQSEAMQTRGAEQERAHRETFQRYLDEQKKKSGGN